MYIDLRDIPADEDSLPYPRAQQAGQPCSAWELQVGKSPGTVVDPGTPHHRPNNNTNEFAAGCAAAGKSLLGHDRRQTPPTYQTDETSSRSGYLFSSGTQSAQSSFDMKRASRNSRSHALRGVCTWRRFSVLLSVVCVCLLLLLTYFCVMKVGHLNWKLQSYPYSVSQFSNAEITPYTLPSTVKHTIPPNDFWLNKFTLENNQFVKINLTLPENAVLAIFMRKSARPSLARYDHYKVIEGQRILSRSKRNADYTSLQKPDKDSQNTAFRLNLDKGDWYIQIFNDAIHSSPVSLNIKQDDKLQTSCANDCFIHGKCVNGKCICFPGYWDYDCSKAECPVICKGRGIYDNGKCICHKGYQGIDCSRKTDECAEPNCHGNGKCIKGKCVCAPGFKGEACEIETCLVPNCSDNGICVEKTKTCKCIEGYTGINCDLKIPDKSIADPACSNLCSNHGVHKNNICVCDIGWSGDNCDKESCNKDCDHGRCQHQRCVCEVGYTGETCQLKSCHRRCDTTTLPARATCVQGQCVCSGRWKGTHCDVESCPNDCNGHGTCNRYETSPGSYSYLCYCKSSWSGRACDVATELICNDNVDNDSDGLVDCMDANCCTSIHCQHSEYCFTAVNPSEFLLTIRLIRPQASFFDNTQFLTYGESTQTKVNINAYKKNQVSVIHGNVHSADGDAVTGVKITVPDQPLYGYTVSRELGLFDLFVNGGGSVMVKFSRKPFVDQIVTVYVAWNKFVNIPTVIMRLKAQVTQEQQPSTHHVISEECLNVHNYSSPYPMIINSLKHSQKSVSPKMSQIILESQVLQETVGIQGTPFHLVYQTGGRDGYTSLLHVLLTGATMSSRLRSVYVTVHVAGTTTRHQQQDPNAYAVYTFAWDKKSVYRQLVYGVAEAKVTVEYVYEDCDQPFIATRIENMAGYNIGSTNIGNWNIDKHHSYNPAHSILHMGDGTNVYLKQLPARKSLVLGFDGTQRDLNCECNGETNSEKGKLKYATGIASGVDGSLYVADWNIIRKVSWFNHSDVVSILKMSDNSLGYKYAIAICPVTGKLLVTDPTNNRIISVNTMGRVLDIEDNYRVIAGTKGRMCLPVAEGCGDGEMAIKAKLSHPTAIAIDKFGVIYFSDTGNIRKITRDGRIQTIIGDNTMTSLWSPMSCKTHIPLKDVRLLNPDCLAINNLDNSLYIMDQNVVYKLTKHDTLIAVLGRKLHCPHNVSHELTSSVGMAFSSIGDLYFIESDKARINRVKVMLTSGEMKSVAGLNLNPCDCSLKHCKCKEDAATNLASRLILNSPSSLTLTPDDKLYISDTANNRIMQIDSQVPKNLDKKFLINNPKTGESFIFNRHGIHMQTLNLLNNQLIYQFSYVKMAGEMRLKEIYDFNKKKIIELDYLKRLKQIELTTLRGYKMLLPDGLSLMKNYSDNDGAYSRFEYDENKQLLKNKETSDGELIFYEYDNLGRISKIVYTNGDQLNLNRKFDKFGLRIETESSAQGKQSVTIDSKTVAIGGMVNTSTMIEDNISTYRMQFPSNLTMNMNTTVLWKASDAKNIIEQRELLSGGLRNVLTWNMEFTKESDPSRWQIQRSFLVYNSAARSPSKQSTARPIFPSYFPSVALKTLSINNVEILRIKYEKNNNHEIISNEDNIKLLQVSYNKANQAIQFIPFIHGKELNKLGLFMNYNENGDLIKWKLEDVNILYNYVTLNNKSRVTSVVHPYHGSLLYAYSNDSSLVTSVTNAGGFRYSLTYDLSGHLSSISSSRGPRDTFKHSFSSQIGLNRSRLVYSRGEGAPGYTAMYNSANRISAVYYPSYEKKLDRKRKIVYTYNDMGGLSAVKFDESSITYIYTDTGDIRKSKVVDHFSSSKRFECEIDTYFTGSLQDKQRISFGNSQKLLTVSFSYSYNDNFQISSCVTKFFKNNNNAASKTILRKYNYRKHGEKDILGEFNYGIRVSDRGRFDEIEDNHFSFTNTFDNLGRATNIRLRYQNLGKYTMSIIYNKDNGKISVMNVKDLSGVFKRSYVYDNSSRLIKQLEGPKDRYTLSWSKNSHLTRIDYPDKSFKKFNINSMGQIVSKDYKYDIDGYLVERYGKKYEYNSIGLLKRCIIDTKIIYYHYDVNRRLVAIENNENQAVVQYFYGDINNANTVTHSSRLDNEIVEYIYDSKMRLLAFYVHVQDKAMTKYYVATDATNSPYLIYDHEGNSILTITYDPLGKRKLKTGRNYNGMNLEIGFSSMIVDPFDSSLLHAEGGKILDTDTGRWTAVYHDEIIDAVKNKKLLKDLRILESYQKFNLINSNHWNRMTDIKDWLHNIHGYNLNNLMVGVDFKGSISSKPCARPYTVVSDTISAMPSADYLSPRHPSLPVRSAYSYDYERRAKSLTRLSTIAETCSPLPRFPDTSRVTRINKNPVPGATVSVRPSDLSVQVFFTDSADRDGVSILRAVFNDTKLNQGPRHAGQEEIAARRVFRFTSVKNPPNDEDLELASTPDETKTSVVKISRPTTWSVRVASSSVPHADVYSVAYAKTVT